MCKIYVSGYSLALLIFLNNKITNIVNRLFKIRIIQ